jgi:putative ABC transport system permease protein
MRAVWMCARAEVRTRWRSLVALSLILGIAGGVVLFSAAGARRTDSAYTRFVEWSNTPDVLVSSGGFGFGHVDLGRAAALPEVAESAIVQQLTFYPTTPSDRLVPVGDGGGMAVANLHDLQLLGRTKLLQGRHADPSRANEVEVGFGSQSIFPVTPGTRLVFHFWRPGVNFLQYYKGELPEPFDRVPKSAFAFSLPVKVVGVTVSPTDLPSAPFGDLLFTPAFWKRYGGRVSSSTSLAVRLHDGEGVDRSFQRDVTALTQGGNPQLSTVAQVFPEVRQFLHPQAVALWMFAALAALAAVLVFGQALSRQTFLESNENPRLRSLGMTPRQLFTVAMVRAAIVGVVGATLAMALAVALSPIMPLGKSRIAEPHIGVSADWFALGLGWLALVAGAMLVGTIPALRAARARGDTLGLTEVGTRSRPSAVVSAAARAGLSPPAVAGVRMAVEPGRGSTATPVRSALVGAAFAIAALSAAFGFAAGFQHVFDTPRLSGWNWDLAAGVPFTGDLSQRVEPPLLASPAVAGLAAVNDSDEIDLRGAGGLHTTTGALATQRVRGDVAPTILSGTWPRSSDEVALGESTLRALHAKVGDRIEVGAGKRTASMRIVGTAAFVNATGTSTGPGDGVGLTVSGLERVVPQVPLNVFFIDLASGTTLAQGRAELAPILQRAGVSFLTANQAESIGDLQPVRGLPLALAGLLALAAAALLGHALFTSIRRRRRDLAILKTLGFVRRQVSATVAWQATTMSLVALVAGLLVGVAAGRWAWSLYANQLGVKAEPTVWLAAVLLIIPVTILVANALAAIPGRIAARTEPAVVLRSE